ncbi:hypothetical protein LNO89_19475 [Klebsiella pneumoniae subsp. pneumoniae]|nr:hypothetical protein [Klebsiella pneumoniae subsp. pneumoniae]
MAWIPAQDVGGDDRQRSDELRIRASRLALSGPERGYSRLLISWRLSGRTLAYHAAWRQTINLLARYPPCRRRRKRVFRRSGAIWRGSSGNSCLGQSTSPAV